MRALQRLVDSLGPRDAAVYLDEVDTHLNPKIGPDRMNRGTQKTLLTPGKNVKRYVRGALDARCGRITWVAGEKKNSGLFIGALKALARVYAGKRRVHVILDNFRIHDSKASRAPLPRRRPAHHFPIRDRPLVQRAAPHGVQRAHRPQRHQIHREPVPRVSGGNPLVPVADGWEVDRAREDPGGGHRRTALHDAGGAGCIGSGMRRCGKMVDQQFQLRNTGKV